MNTKKEQEILEEQNEPEVLIEVDIPDNSVVWNGHSYYYFERNGITWEEARENCGMFADEDMQAYFNSKDWYTGTIPGDEFDESMLNDYERENTYLIVDYEAKMGYY